MAEGKGPAFKPALLVCYLCGQQFGTASLAIHQPQCFQKKTVEWERADPGKRGPRPKDPATAELNAHHMTKEEFNNQQFSQFTENMAQCENCGRRFLPDRLEVHLRSCKPGQGSRPVGGKEAPRPTTQNGRPPTSGSGANEGERQKGPAFKPALLVCYLCGQQFGTASLAIHQPQCFQKKTVEWERADPGKRGPRPKDPATAELNAHHMTKEEFNNQQFSQFTENMAQCENCGRRFLPDRLEVHLRSCKPGQGSRPVGGKSSSSSSEVGRRAAGTSTSSGATSGERAPEEGRRGPAFKPTLLVCNLCGQQFGTASLNIHQPQCYEKKLTEWERADPGKRGPRPKDPAVTGAAVQGMSREEFNNQQFNEFTENMAQCENCGRKFLPDRLEVHLRSCKPGQGSKPVAARASSTTAPRPTSTGSASQMGPVPAPTRGSAPPSSVASSSKKKLPPKLRAIRNLLFDDVDTNGDGVIDTAELRRAVNDMKGCGADDEELNELIQSLDLNRDGVVDKAEWLAMQREAARLERDPRNARLPAADQPALAPSGDTTEMSTTRPVTSRRCVCGTLEPNVTVKFCGECGSRLPAAALSSAALPASSATTVPSSRPAMEPTSGTSSCPASGTSSCPASGTSSCPACGEAIDAEEDNVCESCGCLLRQNDGGAAANVLAVGDDADGPDMLCEECGEVFSPGSRFCETCGGELTSMPQRHLTTRDDQSYAAQEAPGSRLQLADHGASRTAGKRNDHDHDGDDAADVPPETVQVERAPCSNCGRKFAVDVLGRHEQICQGLKSRRAFDSRKHRVEGTDMAPFVSKGGGAAAASSPIPRSSCAAPQTAAAKQWKQQSEEFRKAMRAARDVDKVLKAGGTAKDLPPPVYSENAHYKPCPFCGRKFAPDVADRHIPKCKDTVNKPKPPPRRH